jgi:hypothetical protein
MGIDMLAVLIHCIMCLGAAHAIGWFEIKLRPAYLRV